MSEFQIAFLVMSAVVAGVGMFVTTCTHWDDILDFIQTYIRPHPWYAIGVLAYFVLFLLLGLF